MEFFVEEHRSAEVWVTIVEQGFCFGHSPELGLRFWLSFCGRYQADRVPRVVSPAGAVVVAPGLRFFLGHRPEFGLRFWLSFCGRHQADRIPRVVSPAGAVVVASGLRMRGSLVLWFERTGDTCLKLGSPLFVRRELLPRSDVIELFEPVLEILLDLSDTVLYQVFYGSVARLGTTCWTVTIPTCGVRSECPRASTTYLVFSCAFRSNKWLTFRRCVAGTV